MSNSMEGVFRNGRVELLEPAPLLEGARVVITPLPSAIDVDLQQRGIDSVAAARLRAKLAAFADDWDRPEMAIYDEV